ncbi:MAG: hypothetical protein IKP73_04715 [Bacteroidales bacterium]|nr:hypothetical protein [Bacteroidales bacterium]
MKTTTTYILLIIALSVLASCKSDDDIQYVRQDKLEIKTIPITAQVEPYLLPDGSIITIVADNATSSKTQGGGKTQNHEQPNSEANASEGEHTTTPDQPQAESSYHIVKISTDGTVTKSPKLTYYLGSELNSELKFDDDDYVSTIDYTDNGEIFFKYRTHSGGLGVSKFESGVYIDGHTDILFDDRFIDGVPLNDGRFAIIHNDNPVMSIYDSQFNLTEEVEFPYLHMSVSDDFIAYNICGNIMLLNTDAAESTHEFYVYSTSGEMLNYGSTPILFDKIINIKDAATNTYTHAYAITGNIEIANDSTSVTASIITKLDSKGSVIYHYPSYEQNEVYNLTEYDGKLIISGFTTPSYSDYFSLNDVMSSLTSTTGKIVVIDAETKKELTTYTISLEGGVMPFAVVPDHNGKFYVYMARIFSTNVGQMGSRNQFGEAIYIYHIDDLNKLNIE